MEDQKPFQHVLSDTNLPTTLRSRVRASIRRAEVVRARTRIGIFAGGAIVSLAAVTYSAKSLLESISQTGFYEYMSLLISGDITILTFWRELAYSLIETIPVVATIGFLAALLLFIWSSAHAYTNARRFVLL